MAELIDHGSTGFIVEGLSDATTAVSLAGDVDRAAVRARAASRFDRASMIDRYVDVYREMLR
jgi:glycosyltransferase involved in cell wall biosynthesis